MIGYRIHDNLFITKIIEGQIELDEEDQKKRKWRQKEKAELTT